MASNAAVVMVSARDARDLQIRYLSQSELRILRTDYSLTRESNAGADSDTMFRDGTIYLSGPPEIPSSGGTDPRAATLIANI